jgi:hypothetical protein
MKHITITKKDGNQEKFDSVSFSRWVCLIEAFDLISEKAKELGIDLEKVLKPVAIEHYMAERFVSVLPDVEYELEHGLLS